MRRTRKLFMVSLACVGILMVLLLTAVLTTHLLANRDMVKSFIISKTAQATGGRLVYDRLDISFLPLPHLKARGIHLDRPDAFEVTAQELSVYPRILPILKGQVSIRRLALIAPEVRVHIGSDPMKTPAPPEEVEGGSLEDGVKTIIGGLFGALAAIDPGTDLQIKQGTVTLAFTDAPDLRISRIDADVSSDDGDLALTLRCQSDSFGQLVLSGSADIEASQASGKISLTGINLHPLQNYVSLPGGLSTQETQATINATVSLDGPETLHSRFDLRLPSLTVMRKSRQLDLEAVAIGGTLTYAEKQLTLSLDKLQSEQPALDLTASASITPAGQGADRSIIEVNAAARQLDVAVASQVSRAIGYMKDIQTAFAVARQGLLTDVIFMVAFDKGPSDWRQTKIKATGHLSRGLVTIPGIAADLEAMDGDVFYEDQKVDFRQVSGNFKGAAFDELNATIDWEKEATLSIASPSVVVDVAPLFTWLTDFKGLSGLKKIITSVDGMTQLSKLHIEGPLAKPADWHFDISGTPEKLKIASPLVPFEIGVSGGTISYVPGKEGFAGVSVDFLDGSLVVSYQSKGIARPESVATRIDGTLGKEAVAWLTTILPIPADLQLKPPVDLSGINVKWSNTGTLSCIGKIKMAGGVEFLADFNLDPQGWHIRRIEFADGSSNATASARKDPDSLAFNFSGNIEKSTAGHILENNRILSGRITGDFYGIIDTRNPMNSTFLGNLEGQELRIQTLLAGIIDLKHFSIEGDGDRLTIAPSDIQLYNSQITVSGTIEKRDGSLVYDLDVKSDRLDADLIVDTLSAAKSDSEAEKKRVALKAPPYQGKVGFQATEFIYGGLTWAPMEADVRLEPENIDIQITKAILCGISTPGKLAFSPRGMRLHITPTAHNVSLQETAACLWHKDANVDANYDLTGEIKLPPTLHDPTGFLTGQMEFSSENGRIHNFDVLMNILSVLNITEIFTGGKSDLGGNGFGYSQAHATAQIGGGKLHLNEILLDGNSLKITGQGSLDLKDTTVDIVLLAAPLKTVDRLINKLPVIRTIIGGSLITIPLRLEGKMEAINVVAISPSDVGSGMINTMGRILKAPFRMVKASTGTPPTETTQKGP